MTFIDAIKQILSSTNKPMTPQEIRGKIKEQYPQFYETESHISNVNKGHYKNLEHAVLAQIYSAVRTNDSFSCDKTVKPMLVTLMEIDEDDDISNLNIEDFETSEGFVYILKTDTFTKNGQEIVKIGITTGDIEKRINQLYSTGVPYKFKVYKTYRTKNFFELESALHKLLDPFKLNKSREFFTEEVIIYVDKIFEIHESIQRAIK